MAGDISQFFGGIKSIQRGVIVITGAVTSNTGSVTSVDMNKTQLRTLGSSIGSAANEIGYLVLTNATTITATRAASSGTTVVSWELTETY